MMMKKISGAGLAVMVVVLSVLLLILSTPWFGYKVMGVIGTSMYPNITEDDIVVIKTDFKELNQGDIICYKVQIEGKEYLILHRIIEICEEWIRTKGDNLPEPDPYLVKPSEIVGKEILVIPKLGILVKALHTIPGFLLFVIAPAALLIYRELKKIFRSLGNP